MPPGGWLQLHTERPTIDKVTDGRAFATPGGSIADMIARTIALVVRHRHPIEDRQTSPLKDTLVGQRRAQSERLRGAAETRDLSR